MAAGTFNALAVNLDVHRVLRPQFTTIWQCKRLVKPRYLYLICVKRIGKALKTQVFEQVKEKALSR